MKIADCHNDLLIAVRHQRERGFSDPFGDRWLPGLRAGGVVAQVLPIVTEEQFVGEGALRRAMLLVEEAYHLERTHADDVAIVRSGPEIAEVIDSGRIALILALEGAEPVGNSLELLDVMQRTGIRMCSLSWNRRTMMADGIAERDTGGVLTALGVAAVKRMEELGVLVDVSHLSEAGFFHVASVAERPFLASHSSCRAINNHPRNLSDDQLRAIAESGGFVGMNAFAPFLVSEGDASVESFVDHVEHAISIVGADKVGLGTDFITDTARIVDPVMSGLLVNWDDIPETRGLERPDDFPGLARAVVKRLGAEDARKVLAENLCDFLSRNLSQA